MKCKYCGKDLVEGAKFCVYCGKPVEEEKIDLPIEDPTQEPEIPSIEESKPVDVNVTEENEVKVEQAPIDQNIEVNVEPTPIELPKEEPEKVAPAEEQKTSEVTEQPKVENTTKVVVKRNNPILLIIIILILLAILGLGGFYVYKNYIEKDNKSSNNDANTTETTDTQEEKEYDKVKAKELVDKYYYEVISEDIFTFKDGISGLVKNAIVINNVSNSKKKVGSCSEYYEENSDAQKDDNNRYTVKLKSTVFDLGSSFGGGCDNNVTDYYEYDDLNSLYKELFGKDTSIPKSDFISGYMTYDYIENKNIFVKLDCRCGGAGGPYYRNYFVQDAKTIGENLIVYVGYVAMYAQDQSSSDPILETTIDGVKVTYKFSETKKDTFEKEFTDKYLDKLDTYEFTFKYEDDHYVFVDMKKK